MVRFPIQTSYQTFPSKLANCDSPFVSVKHQCLTLLRLCSSVQHLCQIQTHILVFGLDTDTYLQTQLIRLSALSSFRDLNRARTLIRHSHNLPTSSWNMLIRGYASSDSPREAVLIFLQMRRQGIIPNKLTFPFLIKACAAVGGVREGKQLQAQIFKYGLDADVYVQNNLISLYGSGKRILDAEKVFDEMVERTIVSWNSVITACVENLCFQRSIEYFVKMRDDGFDPDETTMVVMLSACAEFGNLSLGQWLHSQLIVLGVLFNCQLGTALVDMYVKSGALQYARHVFDRMEERNVWTWSAMILGLAQHGFAGEALKLYPMMTEKTSIRPNYVTFLGVLSACSHSGMVTEAFQYFHDMEHKHGIKPMMIHYGAMVDILSRAGRLKEAHTFIKNMPMKADPIVWRTLLSACSIHDLNDYQGFASKVRKKLLQLEPKRSGNLVMVANLYSEVGMWEKAANVRKIMQDRRMKKRAGESCIELNGSMYHFFSGYDSQSDSGGIHQILDVINMHMKIVVD